MVKLLFTRSTALIAKNAAFDEISDNCWKFCQDAHLKFKTYSEKGDLIPRNFCQNTGFKLVNLVKLQKRSVSAPVSLLKKSARGGRSIPTIRFFADCAQKNKLFP